MGKAGNSNPHVIRAETDAKTCIQSSGEEGVGAEGDNFLYTT